MCFQHSADTLLCALSRYHLTFRTLVVYITLLFLSYFFNFTYSNLSRSSHKTPRQSPKFNNRMSKASRSIFRKGFDGKWYYNSHWNYPLTFSKVRVSKFRWNYLLAIFQAISRRAISKYEVSSPDSSGGFFLFFSWNFNSICPFNVQSFIQAYFPSHICIRNLKRDTLCITPVELHRLKSQHAPIKTYTHHFVFELPLHTNTYIE